MFRYIFLYQYIFYLGRENLHCIALPVEADGCGPVKAGSPMSQLGDETYSELSMITLFQSISELRHDWVLRLDCMPVGCIILDCRTFQSVMHPVSGGGRPDCCHA